MLPLATRDALNRLKTGRLFKNHLETCFSEAVAEGRSQAAVAELVDAVKFNAVLTGPEASLAGAATDEPRSASGSARSEDG